LANTTVKEKHVLRDLMSIEELIAFRKIIII